MADMLQAQYGNMGAEMLQEVKGYVTHGDGDAWKHLDPTLVCLHVSHSNLNRRMIEIRFDKHATIEEVKYKLHRHTGTPAMSQRLVLKDGGQPIANMDDDTKKLGFYSPESGMEIHVVDTDPFSMSRGGGLEDESQIQKYRMTDDAYEKRQGTVREYIRQQKEKDPNWKPPKPQMMAGNPWMKAPAAEEVPTGPETVEGIAVGMRCRVHPGERRGEVRFVGTHDKLSEGHWVGVRFDEPVGKSDGTRQGERIFECEDGHGGWIRGVRCEVGDFPEEDLLGSDSDDEDEI